MKTIKTVGLLAAVTVAMSALVTSASYAAARCNLFLSGAAFCEKPITPGVTIESGTRRPFRCTAGPLVIPTRDRRLTYLLTAGHCIRSGGQNGRWYSRTRAGGALVEIGQAGPYVFNLGADIGVIRVTNANWIEAGNTPVFAATAEWLRNEETTFPILGETTLRPREENCAVGQTNGGLCGEIAATSQTFRFRPSGITVAGLTYDQDVYSASGNSGGPVLVSKLGGYDVEGTIVGKKEHTFQMIYEPLGTALRELNALRGLSLELLTTANEERPVQNKEEKEEGERIEAKEKEEEVSERVQKEEEEAGEKAVKEELEEEERELKEKAEEEARNLPKILNKGKEVARAVRFSGESKLTSRVSILGNSLEVTCSATKTEGEFEAARPLGPFHFDFERCTTSLGGTCTGLGEREGIILSLGTFHIVYDKLGTGTELGGGVLFLVANTHFECTVSVIKKLILTLGQLLCLITPINTLSKKATVTCETTSTLGDPKETVYWNGAGTEVNIKEGLLSSENDSSFTMSAESTKGEIEAAEEIEIMA